MPTTSRSALEFMRRSGMVPTPKLTNPRLDTGQLRINAIPLERNQLDPEQMLDVGGHPPPDRGITDQWPPLQEVREHGSPISESE